MLTVLPRRRIAQRGIGERAAQIMNIWLGSLLSYHQMKTNIIVLNPFVKCIRKTAKSHTQCNRYDYHCMKCTSVTVWFTHVHRHTHKCTGVLWSTRPNPECDSSLHLVILRPQELLRGMAVPEGIWHGRCTIMNELDYSILTTNSAHSRQYAAIHKQIKALIKMNHSPRCHVNA